MIRTREDDSRIQLLCQQNFPFVAFGRTDDELIFPFVDEDSIAGVRMLVEHFISLGHRRIGFIAPPSGLMFGVFRRRGFLETMADNDLPVEAGWVVEGDLTQRGGARAIEHLIDLEPALTAVICGNDLMAIGAMNQLQKFGLDMAIAGFDDIPIATYTNPSLTTVRQPIYEIGQLTCSILVDIINGRPPEKDHILLTPELIVRESSGAALVKERR